jgi:hypothetical protein
MKYLKRWHIFESKSIKDMESYKEGDYIQTLMDIGFKKWRTSSEDLRHGTQAWTYADMVNWMGKKDQRLKLLVLVGQYDSQVNNGGHSQYYDNGYASNGKTGYGDVKKDIQLHIEMVELMDSTGLKNRDYSCRKAYQIMEKFEGLMEDYEEKCDECEGGWNYEGCDECDGGTVEVGCEECGGSGEDEDEEICSSCSGSGSMEGECDECDGSGELDVKCDNCDEGYVSHDFISELDDPYYQINDRFMDVCNEWAKEVIDEILS